MADKSLKMADKLFFVGAGLVPARNAEAHMPFKKNDLIRILSQYHEPVTITTVQEALANQVPARTLRRWLQTLRETGKVITTGQYKSQRYQLAPTVEHPPAEHPFYSAESLAILEKLQQPIYQRDPCTYNEAWLTAYIPNQTFYLSATQRKDLAKNSGLMLEDKSADTYTRKIFDRLLIDLSYNSSRLEGNTYSLLDTQLLVIDNKVATDKLDMEKVMILNHKEAIKFLVQGSQRIAINTETVRTMHYLLADGLLLPEQSGQIREEAVRVCATTYLPIEGKQRLEKLLEIIINKANAIHDPFEQSFFLLVHISYLQAFLDVNKRTARLCANIPLVKNNLTPLSFNDIEQDDYISSINAIYEYNTAKVVPSEDHEKFIQGTLNEIKHLESFKLAGLGASGKEFEAWKKLDKKYLL